MQRFFCVRTLLLWLWTPAAFAAPPGPGGVYEHARQGPSVPSALCEVSGSVTLDPNDHSNGFTHYSGTVTFTAKQALTGVNLWLTGPEYTCTCVDCPTLSSNATGIKPGSTFTAGQSRSYAVDCGAWQTTIDGAQGRAVIEHFVAARSDSNAGTWVDASCSGRFVFKQTKTVNPGALRIPH